MVLQYDTRCNFDEFAWEVEALENISIEMLNVDIVLTSGPGISTGGYPRFQVPF
jgi:hypothetical protein